MNTRTCTTALLLLGMLVMLPAHAQTFPNRPLRIIVPLSARRRHGRDRPRTCA